MLSLLHIQQVINILYEINLALLRVRHCVAVLLLLSTSSYAQNTKITLRNLDQLQYPLITGSLCVKIFNGIPLTVDSSEVSISQNGIPLSFQIQCPELGKSLSIAQVLDNSGSMSSYLPSLKQASSIMVDSMRAGDEMALLSFATNTRLLQNFTQSKNSLKLQLQTMYASGATALYDALIEALDILSSRSGRKVIVLISDGADNMSIATLDDVIVKAKSLDVVIYCVGIGAKSAPEQELIRIATETGGRYFLGKFPGELITIFDELSKEIYSSCCSIYFTVRSCTDSLPSTFHVEYKRGNETASFDTLITFPWRPDTLTLTTVAPDRMAAGDFSFVNFLLDPPISADLPLTYTVDVQYNPNLLALEPVYAISIGTISQGKNISLQIISPGHVRISASSFYPAMRTGSLFTLGFRALTGDTSRKVPVKIVAANFKQGCSNVIMKKSDTIEVCQCIQLLRITVNPQSRIVSNDTYLMNVQTSKASLNRSFIVRGEISFDPTFLQPVNMTTGNGDRVGWSVRNDSLLVFDEAWYRPLNTDSTLFVIEWNFRKPKSAAATNVNLVRFNLWSRCCYEINSVFLANFLIDGMCNRLAVRKQSATLKSVFPNPTNPAITVSIDVANEVLKPSKQIRLMLFTPRGECIAVIAEEQLTAGNHRFSYDTSSLQSGLYYVVLDVDRERQYQPFIVVK